MRPLAPDNASMVLRFSPLTMWRRFWWTQAICAAIALVLAALGSRATTAWIYSALIGTASWALIDGGRHGLARWRLARTTTPDDELREGWPGWGWMAPVVALGALGGWWLGSLAGDALTGRRSAPPLDGDWRRLAGLLAVPLVAAVALTWFFYARSRMASIEATVAQTSRQATEAQLKLLESQLEPHMLFNTLANLRALIGVDPPRAQAMLDRLIAYLRATLGASQRPWHPLSAEFERCTDYLALMAIRMGPRLAVRTELPPALRDVPVPTLLLQPLVENAILHGLEPKVDGGRIEIAAACDGDRLRLTVRDTGAGPGAAPTAGTGFGLPQVRERLATLYGDRAVFELHAADDAEGGTVAAVTLPFDTSPP